MAFDLFTGTDSYIASDELRHAVNVAVALARPLLVRGEPGTGKTVLAENVARALGLPLLRWHVKSTTKAKDGLYVYDTVARLHDSRFGDGNVTDIERYIKLGPLGQALAADHRVVLLIDEIDKADVEFPNDLLLELDAMRFRIDETGREVVARERPVVIITSNNEKELPDAFLRRCVFHYIEFPGRELMAQIIRVHHPDLTDRVLDQTLEVFYGLRSTPRLRKKPTTSELIDWICALNRAGVDLGKIGGGIPFLGTLLKTEQDVELIGKRGKA
ncbi:MAG: MoxR family ATPase [Kofleriaceae bacterium]|jgi:MoxR-like ATPase|nr:MoxR family ATPase [Kofleriaceae bacterium]MBP6837542.1 MoxR family ATPase [Kofleriaceae bacterium]MBP9204731.1 MoxR family ATPase [Kofleriaceae bacterium]